MASSRSNFAMIVDFVQNILLRMESSSAWLECLDWNSLFAGKGGCIGQIVGVRSRDCAVYVYVCARMCRHSLAIQTLPPPRVIVFPLFPSPSLPFPSFPFLFLPFSLPPPSLFPSRSSFPTPSWKLTGQFKSMLASSQPALALSVFRNHWDFILKLTFEYLAEFWNTCIESSEFSFFF